MLDRKDLKFKRINLVFAPIFATWRKDAELGRQVGWAIDPKKWNISDEIKWISERLKDKSSYFWACMIGGDVIGRVGIYNIDFSKKVGEVSILIGKEKDRDKGYGKQMLEFIIGKGYSDLALKDIYATIFVDNLDAIRFFERNRFKKSGKIGVMNFLDEKRQFFYLDHVKN